MHHKKNWVKFIFSILPFSHVREVGIRLLDEILERKGIFRMKFWLRFSTFENTQSLARWGLITASRPVIHFYMNKKKSCFSRWLLEYPLNQLIQREGSFTLFDSKQTQEESRHTFYYFLIIFLDYKKWHLKFVFVLVLRYFCQKLLLYVVAAYARPTPTPNNFCYSFCVYIYI
jgi:hypothetical protein